MSAMNVAERSVKTMELNKIYTGDVLQVLKTFPDESIDMVMTSPPYFGLRNYGENLESVWGGDITAIILWLYSFGRLNRKI